MQFPMLLFADVSFLFAVGSAALLVTAELSSAYYGQTNLVINKKRLKKAAYAAAALFLVTAAIKIVSITLS